MSAMPCPLPLAVGAPPPPGRRSALGGRTGIIRRDGGHLLGGHAGEAARLGRQLAHPDVVLLLEELAEPVRLVIVQGRVGLPRLRRPALVAGDVVLARVGGRGHPRPVLGHEALHRAGQGARRRVIAVGDARSSGCYRDHRPCMFDTSGQAGGRGLWREPAACANYNRVVPRATLISMARRLFPGNSRRDSVDSVRLTVLVFVA